MKEDPNEAAARTLREIIRRTEEAEHADKDESEGDENVSDRAPPNEN